MTESPQAPSDEQLVEVFGELASERTDRVEDVLATLEKLLHWRLSIEGLDPIPVIGFTLAQRDPGGQSLVIEGDGVLFRLHVEKVMRDF